MSSNALDGRSVVLRLEFSIADAVRHRGLLPVIATAVRAWWAQRPPRYVDLPAYLREDVGLPPASPHPRIADPWRLHPPERGRR